MSSIFGALSTTAAALEAQRRGLEVAGQNIANANTVGYTRRIAVLKERPALAAGEAGNGVEVAQVIAVRDLFLGTRIRQEQQGLARDTVVAEALSLVEAGLGRFGGSVDGQISAFFNAFSALAEDNSSLVLRDAVLREARKLGQVVREMSSRFTGVQADADVGVRGTVADINRLTRQITDLNGSLDRAAGAETESIIDRRAVALRELADMVDINVSDASGVMVVSTAGGRTLLSGTHAIGLTMTNMPSTGFARVWSGGQDITADVGGGRLLGWLQVRDERMPAYRDMLDNMAWSIASEVNAIHRAGFDLQGDPGVDLFEAGPMKAGAADALRVSAVVAADARLVAAADATAANGGARAMAVLNETRIVDGATLTDYWGQLVYRVGGDAASALRAQEGRQSVMDQLQRLSDAASGVSLDEEAAALMRYQRAYQANSRYFTTVNDVLEELMRMVR